MFAEEFTNLLYNPSLLTIFTSTILRASIICSKYKSKEIVLLLFVRIQSLE